MAVILARTCGHIVADYWREIGKAGWYIWRFRLVKIVEAFTQEL